MHEADPPRWANLDRADTPHGATSCGQLCRSLSWWTTGRPFGRRCLDTGEAPRIRGVTSISVLVGLPVCTRRWWLPHLQRHGFPRVHRISVRGRRTQSTTACCRCPRDGSHARCCYRCCSPCCCDGRTARSSAKGTSSRWVTSLQRLVGRDGFDPGQNLAQHTDSPRTTRRTTGMPSVRDIELHRCDYAQFR